jgi:DNA-binding transcriptional LysR family regulator
MKDRLQTLIVFRRTARTGSFSRAARELGMSQASVSRAIAALERELGVSLMTRTTRAVSLTDRGAEYLARIEALLDALEEADHEARGEGALHGLLRIGLSSSFGVREIIPRLPEFLQSHPHLRIDLAMSDARQDLVVDGIDVAFRLGALADSSLVSRHISSAPRVIVAAPSYLRDAPPIETPEDLQAHTIVVGPGVTAPLLDLQRAERRVTVPAEGRVTCAANEGATALACAGIGLTVSSIWGVARELSTGALVQVLCDWRLPPVELHAVFPPGRTPRPAARACADFLWASMKRRPNCHA